MNQNFKNNENEYLKGKKEEDICKKPKSKPVNKAYKFYQKAKLFLKNHFPERIWAKPQENKKGHKF